ncbi:hypothetical protein IV01_13960 [Pseudomonas syringae]|uniref:Uncharacterized protein n=1 Tax=Pseudomonas syringae TaxID=317 RepID=A0A085VHL1_PSESX|nr:hypothetical protein IV01_13960 [Pseudomonas syringae]
MDESVAYNLITRGSELARGEAGASEYITGGRNIAFASKLAPTGDIPVGAHEQREAAIAIYLTHRHRGLALLVGSSKNGINLIL